MSDSGNDPLDSDTGIDQPAPSGTPPSLWLVLTVISVGGVLGALARYGLQQVFPHEPGQFGWATFVANTTGCLLIGVLMASITELQHGDRLLRPFLGVGVLGGFTTFSTYIVDIQQALAIGAARTALIYLAATVLAALLAVGIGSVLMTRILRWRLTA